MIEELKHRSDDLLRENPAEVDRITRAALNVAECLPEESLARPLARWARGNWAAFVRPSEAIDCYHDAFVGYERVGDIVAMARISSNLSFIYTTLSRPDEAIAAIERAQVFLMSQGPEFEHYLANFGVNYGWLLYERGRYTDALAANESALVLANRYQKPEVWAELQVNQAFTLGMVGRLNEVEELLLDSRKSLIDLRHWITVARIDLNLGEFYSAKGRPATALRRFRMALDAFESLGVTMEYASVLLFEADLLARLGALRAARDAYAQAQGRFAEQNMPLYVAMALLAGAAVRRRRNPDDRQALLMLTEAAAIFLRLELPLLSAEVDLERAALAMDQGDIDSAELWLSHHPSAQSPPDLLVRYDLLCGRFALQQNQIHIAQIAYTQALATSRDAFLIWAQRDALAGLGNCLLTSNPADARVRFEEAAQIDEVIRADLSVEELTASFQSRQDDLFPPLIRLAIEEGMPLDALRSVWRWHGGPLLDLLAACATGTEHHNIGNAELEPLRQQIEILRWQVARAIQEEAAEPTIDTLRARLRELEQRHLEQRRHLRQRFSPGTYELPSSPQFVLSRLDADCLIEFVLCGDELLALCADVTGCCSATWLGSIKEILDCLNRLDLKILRTLGMNPAQRVVQQDMLMRETRSILQRLYTLLITPLVDLIHVGKLLISPCAPLHLIPFAALWDGSQHLVERYEIELIPSGALLAIPAPPFGPVGPPLVIGASAEGGLGSVEVEVAAVAAALPGCTCLLDDSTALVHLIGLKQAPRVLHISAHTEIDPEPSIFSSIQLAGSMLTIERCYDLLLAGTELAVLNGCTTASGMESGGALLAFQSALLIAGAQRVLSSLWQINDDFAAAFMVVFYAYLAAGQLPPTALRAAQIDLMQRPETAYPAAWAAFAITRR
ncbi:MAG: CHAT domain-containing tetratricopeptide repeat protein [Chloroflexales bacterium]